MIPIRFVSGVPRPNSKISVTLISHHGITILPIFGTLYPLMYLCYGKMTSNVSKLVFCGEYDDGKEHNIL